MICLASVCTSSLIQTGSCVSVREGLDWGYRFGYYFDRDRLGGAAHGAHWLDDTSTGPNFPALSAKNGYVKERPIFAPDFRTGDLTFDQLKAQAKTSQYTPPHVVD